MILPLLVDFIYEKLFEQPLTVYCQQETHQVLMNHIFNQKIWPNFFALPSKEKSIVRFEPLLSGQSATISDKKITMAEVEHTVLAVSYIVQNEKPVALLLAVHSIVT